MAKDGVTPGGSARSATGRTWGVGSDFAAAGGASDGDSDTDRSRRRGFEIAAGLVVAAATVVGLSVAYGAGGTRSHLQAPLPPPPPPRRTAAVRGSVRTALRR